MHKISLQQIVLLATKKY